MASVNVSEAEFTWVADAANRAQDRGARGVAKVLDKLARKMNAALSTQSTFRQVGRLGRSCRTKAFTWRDVPSTLT